MDAATGIGCMLAWIICGYFLIHGLFFNEAENERKEEISVGWRGLILFPIAGIYLLHKGELL